MWRRGEIAPREQFLLLSTVFCYLMLDFYVKRRTLFYLRDKRLFDIIKVEIMRVDCILICCLYILMQITGLTFEVFCTSSFAYLLKCMDSVAMSVVIKLWYQNLQDMILVVADKILFGVQL